MDTGYVSLIDEATRREVLQRTSAITSGLEFVAGVYVDDSPGDELNADTGTTSNRWRPLRERLFFFNLSVCTNYPKMKSAGIRGNDPFM